MMQRFIYKMMLLCLVLSILFVFLPVLVGLQVSNLSHHLVYSKDVPIIYLKENSQILIRNKDNQIEHSSVRFIDEKNKVIELSNQVKILERDMIGKKLFSIPYLGKIYALFIHMSYKMKLVLGIFILFMYMLPDFVVFFMKNRRIPQRKML